MSEKDEKAGAGEGAAAEGSQCCPDMAQMMAGKIPDCCAAQMRRMTSHGMPDDCGAKMREMMSRFFTASEKAESSAEEA